MWDWETDIGKGQDRQRQLLSFDADSTGTGDSKGERGKGQQKLFLQPGLPLTGFGREKQKFKEYLFRKEQPICFFYEGERYEIQIEDVKLFPQGYSALALYPEYLKDELLCFLWISELDGGLDAA